MSVEQVLKIHPARVKEGGVRIAKDIIIMPVIVSNECFRLELKL